MRPDHGHEILDDIGRGSFPGYPAIGRLRGCRYFEKPVGLPQFCGPRFVKRVNQGRYDDVNPDRTARPAAAGDRPTANQAAAEWSKAAADPERARRQAEYLAAKARKAAAPARQDAPTAIEPDADLERIRAEALRRLRQEAGT